MAAVAAGQMSNGGQHLLPYWRPVGGYRIAIASYLGKGDSFGTSILDFCLACADQNERDYESPVKAVKSRRLLARTGLQGVSVAVA